VQTIKDYSNSLDVPSYEQSVGATADYYYYTSPSNTSTTFMSAGDNHYYYFTPTTTGTMNLTLSVPYNSDYDVHVLDASGNVIGGSGAGTGLTDYASFSVVAGSTYRVRVYYWSGAAGYYTLSLSSITPSIPPSVPLYQNSPVDVSLSAGAYMVYRFTPSSSGTFKFFTGPYGGFGGSNDTYLELYSNSGLTNLIASNDDSNQTLFSEFNISISAGTTYYLKFRHYSPSGSVYARLTATMAQPPIQAINVNSPVDVQVVQGEYKPFKFTPLETGDYTFLTSSYGGSGGSSDTYLHLYSDSNLSNQLAYNEDLDMFMQGISVGIDDNILFGLYNRFYGLAKYEDEYYYLVGHLIVDCGSVTFYSGLSVSSAAASQGLNAAAFASASAGELALATGVGAGAGVVTLSGALGLELTSVVARAASVAATAAALRSGDIMYATKNKLNNLPTNTAGNFRTHLKQLVGDPPVVPSDAHHMLPQEFSYRFLGKVDIHDAKYGSWVERSKHRSEAYAFNKKWENYFIESPNPTTEQILDYARTLASEFGYTIHF